MLLDVVSEPLDNHLHGDEQFISQRLGLEVEIPRPSAGGPIVPISRLDARLGSAPVGYAAYSPAPDPPRLGATRFSEADWSILADHRFNPPSLAVGLVAQVAGSVRF